jgi:hypothetical protein
MDVIGINSIKKQCLTVWIRKEDLTTCFLQDTHVIDKNKHWLRGKGWEKFYQANDQPTGRISNTYIKQSRLQTYIGKMK